MKGGNLAYVTGFGLFVLIGAAAFGLAGWQGAVARWLAWPMSAACGAAGSLLLIWAAICVQRRMVWVFEANGDRLVWYRTDRRGVIRERKEVAVGDVAAVWHPRDEGGDLCLRLRSGECVAIGAFVQSDTAFLEWMAVNHPGVTVKVE